MERTSIPHVRISSVEPMDISERLLKVMARYPQRIAPFYICPCSPAARRPCIAWAVPIAPRPLRTRCA